MATTIRVAYNNIAKITEGLLKKYCPLILIIIGISGCGVTTAESVKTSLGVPEPDIALFNHCSSYGCKKKQSVSFTETEWHQVREIFSNPARTAEEERQLLPGAIALMEKVIGPKTGTSDDIARSWLFTFAPGGQLDCIDESINTTTYLNLLNNAGFIAHHDIGQIAIRGNGIGFTMAHNSATLIEHDSGKSYAIDSWFRANGVKPDIVPLQDWLDGWKPPS